MDYRKTLSDIRYQNPQVPNRGSAHTRRGTNPLAFFWYARHVQ